MLGIIKAPFKSPAVQFQSLPMSTTIVLGDGQNDWYISAKVFINQHDGHNCGPIACIKILEVLHMTTLRKVREELKTRSYCQIVMDKYKELITELQTHLHISKKVRIQDCVKTMHHLCLCNTFEHINNQAFQFMTCCKKTNCTCKDGRCNASCGCTRGKRGCSSSCTCNGNCSNPHKG